MPSTDFLLYLVTAIFALFLIMNFYKDDTDMHYKYVPIYTERPMTKYRDDEGSYGDRNRNGDVDNTKIINNNASQNANQANGACGNPSCLRRGSCFCRGSQVNVNVADNGLHGGPIDPLRKFDYDAVNDEFTPPFRRSYYDDYNYVLHPNLYPTYTRGPPGRFRKVGTLIAQGVSTNDNYKFMNLNGREKYPGREYEYYATSTNRDLKIKFFIDTKGKEIHDGDTVTVPELEGYTYVFREDEDLSPRYDPYYI